APRPASARGLARRLLPVRALRQERPRGAALMRLYVLVEGPTEETSRDRQGRKSRGGGSWIKWRRDLVRLLNGHTGPGVRFTTMFDLYGLPRDFPGLAEHGSVPDTASRADLLEAALSADIGDFRLIAYLQRHEFEALVLAGLDALAQLLDPEDRPG